MRQELSSIDSRISDIIHADMEMKTIHDTITNVKGIGKVTASVLLAEVPELGSIGHRQVSALLGVAPFNKESGSMKGQQHIQGGRKSARCVLYMATLSAIRSNEQIKMFYKHLKENGKKPKVAIVACMRKLIIILNAKVRDALNTPLIHTI